jgi:hypothetical protein
MKPPFIIAILLVPALAGPAEARHPKPEPPTLIERLAGAVQGFARTVARAAATSAAAAGDAAREAPGRLRAASYEVGDEEIVPNPPGCPPRLFCGCGVSIKVYGHRVVSPNLDAASTWAGFPRAPCAPGRVAVWSGHVAYILECRGSEAKFWDPNSGGGLTRVHWRELPSIIVEPPANL